MERREAILLIRQICSCLSDANMINSVSLKPLKKTSEILPQNYELHIGTWLDEYESKLIRSIVARRHLLIDEAEGYFIIREAENEEIKIMA